MLLASGHDLLNTPKRIVKKRTVRSGGKLPWLRAVCRVDHLRVSLPLLGSTPGCHACSIMCSSEAPWPPWAALWPFRWARESEKTLKAKQFAPLETSFPTVDRGHLALHDRVVDRRGHRDFLSRPLKPPSQSEGRALDRGPKHSGKSTAARQLIDRAVAEDLSVAGILAPSVYRDGILTGFDLVDLSTGRRAPLARLARNRSPRAGRFAFLPETLKQGNAALGLSVCATASLIVVDEFGPLELRGQGLA